MSKSGQLWTRMNNDMYENGQEWTIIVISCQEIQIIEENCHGNMQGSQIVHDFTLCITILLYKSN